MKRVGIIGLGTVGGGFYEISRKRKEYRITKVLNRSSKKYLLHQVPKPMVAEDVDELITDIDVLVETVGGIDFPYEVVTKALNAGKDVVTANKALIASHGEELVKLARKRGAKLLFGASVGGGMPALRYVKYHATGKIIRIYGILNATSNFLLSKASKGMTFKDAIALAQREGYAESDPTDDVEGIDAARKLAIICGVVSGILPEVDKIPKSSVCINMLDFEYAKRLKATVKPLVYLEFENDSLKMWSGPVAIPEYSRLSNVSGTENCLVVEGENGTSFLSGIGAGKNPTAFAVMADVIDAVNDVSFNVEFRKKTCEINQPNFEEFRNLKIFHPSI